MKILMDKNKWFDYLTKFNEISDGEISNQNHLDVALNFFKKCNIDKQGLKFLDVGCGSGTVMNHIKSEWYGVEMNNSSN